MKKDYEVNDTIEEIELKLKNITIELMNGLEEKCRSDFVKKLKLIIGIVDR
ncbi:MAG: hypothetical protein ACTSPY_18465 [Candidatus Helarchaeota archaeon]